ncbi:short-chain dehydrogenase [Geopyxis carbonaria]|nr:short-chain dehydrogenase [Geopyxis carbonaria]
MSSYGAETTSDQVAADLKDQIQGKTILITGVSPGGLGAAAALSIAASSPALIILAGRSESKLAATAATIAAAHPDTPTRTLILDLGSLASVRAAAATVNTWPERIDVLLNNAGIMAQPFALTPEGFESQFGTNHIGHFVFTNLILSKVTRVVNVSSDGHQLSDIHYDDPNFTATPDAYNPWIAYGQAKTANILFAVALAARGVQAYALHPGVIMTNLVAHMGAEETAGLIASIEARGRALKTLQQGAATHVYASFCDEAQVPSGSYLADCRVAEVSKKGPNANFGEDPDGTEEKRMLLRAYAADKENAERLWKLSEELVGEKFEVARK